MIATVDIREYALDLVNTYLGLISQNIRTIAPQPVGGDACRVHFSFGESCPRLLKTLNSYWKTLRHCNRILYKFGLISTSIRQNQ